MLCQLCCVTRRLVFQVSVLSSISLSHLITLSACPSFSGTTDDALDLCDVLDFCDVLTATSPRSPFKPPRDLCMASLKSAASRLFPWKLHRNIPNHTENIQIFLIQMISEWFQNDFRFISRVSLDSGLSWPAVGQYELNIFQQFSTVFNIRFRVLKVAKERRAARGWTPIKVVPDKKPSLLSYLHHLYHSANGKESVKVFTELEM